MARKFEDKEATREQVPIMVGLMGPSGSGKTYSALRLGSGIQRVVGGELFMVDTEARRSLHYADTFKFRHVTFEAPFASADYTDAIEHCIKNGAKTIVIDSMSHEHEGPGGVLEMHEAEVRRLSQGDPNKANSVKMLAWAKPKAERRRMINTILQKRVNMIFCFRAKEKVKPDKSEKSGIKELGFMPIAGEEFLYEMTLNCLLLPGASGVPTWQAEHRGEQQMIKLPRQFAHLATAQKPLDEETGQMLAVWAAGDEYEPLSADLVEKIAKAGSVAELEAIAELIKQAQQDRTVSVSENKMLRAAYQKRMKDIEAPTDRQPGDDD